MGRLGRLKPSPVAFVPVIKTLNFKFYAILKLDGAAEGGDFEIIGLGEVYYGAGKPFWLFA